MRQPKPWFRTSKNAWYVEHRFRKVRLGPHPEGAPPPKASREVGCPAASHGGGKPPSPPDTLHITGVAVRRMLVV